MKKRYITAIILLALLGLGAAGTWITATDVTVQRYMIWLNSGGRTAATADSILGFIGGSDTATLIPIPSGGGSGDTSYFDLTGAILSPKTAVDTLDFDAEVVYVDGSKVFTDPHRSTSTMLGIGAGETSATHGTSNVGIGYYALRDVESGGTYNTAVGGYAGAAVTTSDYNSFFGYQAGDAITGSGDFNTLLGARAGSALTGGDNTVAVGYAALFTGTTSGNNTAVGYSSMGGNAGANNTAVGYNSGYTGDGSSCVFIGNYAGYYETGSNKIIIDNLDRTNEANQRLHAPFYSVTNATPASQVTQIGGTGKVGINEASPDSTLHVGGGAVVETDILVGGGWTKWTPTFTWTGGTPSAPTSTVARYSVTNNTVEFNMYVTGTNDSGSTLTALGVTPPIYPPDINSFANVMTTMVIGGTGITTGTRYTSLLDMNDNTERNRIIKVISIVLNNSQDYEFAITGTYEITTK